MANKQYLDDNGLGIFWSEVKDFYSESGTAVVDNAAHATGADLASAAEKLEEGRYVKLSGDATGKVLFDGSNNVTLKTTVDIKAIEEHEILKLFGERVEVSKFASVSAAVAAAPNGSTIVFDANSAVSVKEDPMTYGNNNKAAIHVSGDSDLTVEVPAGVVLDLSDKDFRAFDVRDGGTLEIVGGGTIKTRDANPVAFLGKNATLIIDGVTMENEDGAYVLGSNGTNTNSNLWIKSGTFKGPNYLPARGSIRIDGGTFTCKQGTVLYIKNGSPTEINGGTFTVTGCNYLSDNVPGRPENAWAHNNNGHYGTACPIIVEGCNYGGYGNPRVRITGGTFVPYSVAGMPGKGYPILVIDYTGSDGHELMMEGTTVSYQHAVVDGGHISSGSGEPSDGWVFFDDSNTTAVTL